MLGNVLPHGLVLPGERHAVDQRVPRQLAHVLVAVEKCHQDGEDEKLPS